ncbi:hypothetical protein RintRC_2463 [Richelia intracellularis]|nr:hypothetical protein RintRC_2463 [Richelia intracellularis]
MDKNGSGTLSQMPTMMQTIIPAITPSPFIPVSVVSNTPGRLRLRFPLLHRQV